MPSGRPAREVEPAQVEQDGPEPHRDQPGGNARGQALEGWRPEAVLARQRVRHRGDDLHLLPVVDERDEDEKHPPGH